MRCVGCQCERSLRLDGELEVGTAAVSSWAAHPTSLMQTCVVIMARPDGTWCMGSHTSHIGSWLCYNIVKAPNAGNTFVLFSQQVMRSTRPDIGLTRPYDSVTAGFRFGYCNLRTWQNYNGAQLLVRGYDAIPGRVNLVSNTLPHNIFRSLVMSAQNR